MLMGCVFTLQAEVCSAEWLRRRYGSDGDLFISLVCDSHI